MHESTGVVRAAELCALGADQPKDCTHSHADVWATCARRSCGPDRMMHNSILSLLQVPIRLFLTIGPADFYDNDHRLERYVRTNTRSNDVEQPIDHAFQLSSTTALTRRLYSPLFST